MKILSFKKLLIHSILNGTKDTEKGKEIMTEQTLQITEEIKQAEENSVKIEYYTLDGKRPVISMCPGDLIIMCNVLNDYASALDVFSEEKTGYEQAVYKYQAGRCRKIQKKLEESLGYDVQKSIEKCAKKKGKKNNDIGEDALVLAIRTRKEKSQHLDNQETKENKRSTEYENKVTEKDTQTGQIILSDIF